MVFGGSNVSFDPFDLLYVLLTYCERYLLCQGGLKIYRPTISNNLLLSTQGQIQILMFGPCVIWWNNQHMTYIRMWVLFQSQREITENTRSSRSCRLFFLFSVRLLSVLRGHSVFSSPPQRPMTSNFEGFSTTDFIRYIYFPIFILEKEPVFSLLNVQC